MLVAAFIPASFLEPEEKLAVPAGAGYCPSGGGQRFEMLPVPFEALSSNMKLF